MSTVVSLSRRIPFPVLAASICFCQIGATPTPLRILDKTPVASLPLNLKGFRAIPGEAGFYLQTGPGAYIAVGLDGQTHSALDVAKVPASDSIKPGDLYTTDLAPDPRGGVIAPVVWDDASKKSRAGILRFDENGDYEALIPLDAEFNPAHAAEFSSAGGFLVTGYDEEGKIHVALFDSRGRMLIPQVLKFGNTDATPGTPENGQTEQPDRQPAIEAGLIQLASGDDDAVYLFNPSSGRKVIRIRPDGQSSEIVLPKPVYLQDASTLPLDMLVSHGNLYLCEAVLDKGQKPEDAMELKRFALSVYDRYTGTLNASFQIDSTFGATLVAASPREFHFLDAKVVAGQGLSFSIIRAAP
ncbi:MAG: hypothetical protein WBE41_18570 [Terracidiphilus sp.]